MQSPGRSGLPSPPVPPPPVVPPLAFVPATEYEQRGPQVQRRPGSAGLMCSRRSMGGMFEPPIRREWCLEGDTVRLPDAAFRCHSRERPSSRADDAAVGSRAASRCRSRDRPISRAGVEVGGLRRWVISHSNSDVGFAAPEAWSPTPVEPSCISSPSARQEPFWSAPASDGQAALVRAPPVECAHGPWVQQLLL